MIAVVGGIIALVTIYFAIRLVMKLVVTKRLLGDMGTDGKLAFYGALAYTIFPVDILPDPIYLDDMAVLGGALFFLTKKLRARKDRQRQAGGGTINGPGAQSAKSNLPVRSPDRTP